MANNDYLFLKPDQSSKTFVWDPEDVPSFKPAASVSTSRSRETEACIRRIKISGEEACSRINQKLDDFEQHSKLRFTLWHDLVEAYTLPDPAYKGVVAIILKRLEDLE